MDNNIRNLERLASMGDLVAQAALERAKQRVERVKSNREKWRENRADHNPTPPSPNAPIFGRLSRNAKARRYWRKQANHRSFRKRMLNDL